MEVILRSKVKLLPLPRSKISWIKTLPPSQFDNPPENDGKTLVAKTLLLTSGNELRYFELDLHKEKEKAGQAQNARSRTKSELKVGREWTHSFGHDPALEILLFDQEYSFDDPLIITRETKGLGFYTKPTSSPSSSSSSGSALIKKGVDISFSSLFVKPSGHFKDVFAMGKIWCGAKTTQENDNSDNSNNEEGAANTCANNPPRLGAIFHDPKDKKTCFYFLQKHFILEAPPAKDGDDILFPLEKIPVQLPAEVEGAVEKVWIIPMPSSPANSKEKSVNDVIILQKEGQLFLFQLNESSQLIKVGDLELPVGLSGMENENEMTVSSLNLFFSSWSVLNLAVNFKSMTVIFSLDEETRQFIRSSFFYFDKGQTPLFFEGQEELRKTPRNEKQQQLFFLLDGPNGLHFSSDSLDFRPIPTEKPTENSLNLPFIKVIAATPSTLSNQPVLFYEYQNAVFAAQFTPPKNGEEEGHDNEGRIDWDIGQQTDRLDEDDDCFNEECLLDSTSFNSSPTLTSGSGSGSGSRIESSMQKLETSTRKNLWDKSILDLIPVKQIVESAALPTGQIQFNLQLIPLVGFSVSYASNSDSSASTSVLGHEDWKISSHPFVVRVRKSVFEKLDKFYLVLDSQPHPLTLTSTNPSSSSDSPGAQIREFTAPTATQYNKIIYYSSSSESSESVGKSYWEFESEGATAFFGQTPDSPTDNALRFEYEARMRNWAGGSATLKFPVEWHLSRFVNHAIGQSFDYNYRPFNSRPTQADPNSKWSQIEPQALFISNVTSIPYKNGLSESNQLQLQFDYEQVDRGEKGQLLRLNGYSMTTESYRQIVGFQYDNSSNSTGMLSGVGQQFDGDWKEMLKFSYSKHAEAFRPFESATNLRNPASAPAGQKTISLLSTVEFPTLKTTVQFTFSQAVGAQLARRPEGTIAETGIGRNRDTAVGTHGFGFSIVNLDNFLHFYKHTDGSVQTVKFAEASELLDIENVKVVLNSSCAFLQLRLADQVKIIAYCFTTNPTQNELNWQKAAEKILPRSTSISGSGSSSSSRSSETTSRVLLSYDGTIFAVDENDWNREYTVWIHEWTETADASPNQPPTYSWTSSSFSERGSRPPRGLQLQGNFLSWMEIFTDRDQIDVRYLPHREKGGWNWDNLKKYSLYPAREDCFTFFSKQFSPGRKDLDNLWDFFHPARPPIETNLIALPSCRMKSDGRSVETVVDFLVLDKDEAVLSHETFPVNQENIQNSANWNWSNFNVGIGPQNQILIGDKATISWDVKSSEWKLEKNSQRAQNSDTVDLKLNDDGLKLQKSGKADTLKITQGPRNLEVVKDLGIKNAGQLLNFFPGYMVTLPVEKDPTKFHVLEFSSRDKSVVKDTKIDGERILPGLTSPQILATLIQPSSSSSSSARSSSSSRSDSSTKIRLRTMAYRPQAILTQVKVDGGKYLQRKTGYDYADTHILANGRLMFGSRKVIPGAQSHVNGWMEYTDSFQGSPKIFDNRGNFIGRMQQPQDSGNEVTSSELASYCLLDVTGSQQILDMRPYFSGECKVGYYGFQEYERKSAGEGCSDWDFPEQNVISNDYPLTGRRFLRLASAKETLSTSFLLDAESGEDYTVSAWVRSSLIKLEDSISPILKAKIQGMEKLTWLSKILLEEDGWHLLQINILCHELDAYKKGLYSDANNDTSTSSPPLLNGQELEVTITISGQKGSKVDVDHVLYAPFGWNSEITVFDPSTLKVTDRILGRNGLLSHNKFDTFGKPLAQINSEGSVMHYEIRAPSPQGTNNTNTDVLVATTKFEALDSPGWYESCDPSLKQSLSIPNRQNWQLSPGFAHHVGKPTDSSESSLLFKIRDQESFLFRFSYNIHIPAFTNSTVTGTGNGTGNGVTLQYKNLDILSIGENPHDNSTALTFGESLFSLSPNLNPATFKIPPTSSISFGILQKERVLVWIGDELKLDAKFTAATNLRIIQREWENVMAVKVPPRASISIGDILILPNPKIQISYNNIFGEKIQEIEVVSKDRIRVGQILYDQLGRNMAATKPTAMDVSSDAPLLSFRSSFVTRFDQERPVPAPGQTQNQTQNQTMQMDGEVSRLNPKDGGFPFSMVEYEPSSFFETVSVEGRPGVDFSIGGRFQKVHQNKNPHDFIRILFPEAEGFQYKVSKTLNSQSFYEEVRVYTKDLDGSEQTHASAAISQTGKNLIATYDYDNRGNLVASHSPQFHTQFKTVLKGGSWENLRKTVNSNGNPNQLVTFYKYDDWNRLAQKSSPDMGIVSMIYEGSSDKVKYTVHRRRETPGQIDTIMYYEYENEGGSLSEVGLLKGFNSTATAAQSESLSFFSSLVKIPKRVVKTQENSELASIFFKTDLVLSSFEVSEGNSTNYTTSANTPIFEDYIEMVDTKITSMNVVTRTALFPTKPGIPALLVPTSFQYNGMADRVVRISLPFQDYGILYRYDMLGQLSSIALSAPNSVSAGGLLSGVFDIANYEYDGSGSVTRERLHGFNKKDAVETKFSYNSPGYPTERQNEFIKESLSYEDDGYGDRSTGAPSSVMTTTSTPFWENPQAKFYNDASDFAQAGVSPKIASFCYRKLEEFGYIKNEMVVKMLHPKMDQRLPVACTSGSVQKVFTEKVLKTRALPLSFKYQYGPHRDLVKVKFVVEQNVNAGSENGNENDPFCSKPLTSENFLEQLKLQLKTNQIERDEASIMQILDKLVNSGFLVKAAANGIFSQVHWKPGKSFFNPALLRTMLKDNVLGLAVVNLMMQHLGSVVGVQIGEDSDDNLKKVWKLLQPAVPQIEQKAANLLQILINDGFLSRSQGQIIQVNSNVFDPEFLAAFDFDSSPNSSAVLKGLVYKTLLSFFNCAVGSSPLDKEVLDTDMNGNFKLFYNGEERIELEYSNGTNQIKTIKIASKISPTKQYEITHDPFGNLNSAPHHKIDTIHYDEITAKPILMRLANGSFLKFRYDLRGERVTKEVFGPSGALLKKIKYLSRDEHGRSLLEEEFTFVSPDIPPKIRTTLYIYNPDRTKGLVGFIRNGKLYNVFTDNINSVRLVILDGHVVGGWDYHPYGTTMNEYVQHEDASIPYRFSGQELDEETGLYNFHARIYDPFLGRFYQIDPEEQFFSPYKYAGNSPLNGIDPDGKFFHLLFIPIAIGILAASGAYVGGSSANNNWNPAKWKWNKPGTWLGMGSGALAGGLIIPTGGATFSLLAPALGTVGAVAAISLSGAGSAYLLAASANQDWDPSRWDFKSPGTYNALFSGIAVGVALPAGFSSYGALVHTFTKPGQVFFIGATVSSGVGMGYLSAAASNQNYNFWEWDYSNPATIVSFGTSGVVTTLSGAAIYRSVHSIVEHVANSGFQNVAKQIERSLKGGNTARNLAISAKQATKVIGKVVGAVTPVGLGGYVALAAANDAWLVVDWTNAGTYAALLSGMWGGWVGGKGVRHGRHYLKKQFAKIKSQKNFQVKKPSELPAASPVRNSIYSLQRYIDILTSKGPKFPQSRSSSSLPAKPQAGPSSNARPNPNFQSQQSLKSISTPASKLTSMGNSKWSIFGFSGQGKGGVVYLNFFQKESQTQSNVQKRIEKEKSKVQKILSFFEQGKPGEEPKCQGQLKAVLCDASPLSTGTGTAAAAKECERKCKLIAAALEGLTNSKLRDGSLGSSKEWALNAESVIERVEKTVMVKSLLEKLERENGGLKLGQDLISANNNLLKLELENPGAVNYTEISNYIKQDISRAVKKSIDQNQGVYQDKARAIASHIQRQIFDTNYKFSLSNWAASNCGKAVVQPVVKKAKKVLKLDNGNRDGIRVGEVDYVAIYNPRTMKKRSRCSQCLVTKENVDVEQLKIILTEEAWLTKIDGVENAVFFQGGGSSSFSNVTLTWSLGQTNATTTGSPRDGRGMTVATTEAPLEEEEDYNYNYDYVDESIVSNYRKSPMYVDMGNSNSPKVERLKREALPTSASSSASAKSHGGIIQSLHKTIKNVLSKPFEMDLDFGFGFPFWTTGEELQEKSSFVHEQPEKSIFHPQISNEEKAEENGGDRAFSTRCLPFFSKGNNQFADDIDILGLSCSSAHGQITVFYPNPREKMLPPLISGQSSSSSSSSWNTNNQLHSFDKNSCQFLSSCHGQNAAYCQGSKSNILYMPNPHAQKPLDSLNDQLLLLLLAQHFLQTSGWFGFQTPDDESTETGKSDIEEEQVLSPEELTSFELMFMDELQRVKEKRERLILELKIQQEKESGFKNSGSFLHFCIFNIEDLEEEFFLDVEKSKLNGFSSQQKMEYLDRLTEMEGEMEEDFQALCEFGRRSNEDFSKERKTGAGNSVWNIVEGLFYTFHHKSQ